VCDNRYRCLDLRHRVRPQPKQTGALPRPPCFCDFRRSPNFRRDRFCSRPNEKQHQRCPLSAHEPAGGFCNLSGDRRARLRIRSPRSQNRSGNSRGKRARNPVTPEEKRPDLERSTDARDSPLVVRTAFDTASRMRSRFRFSCGGPEASTLCSPRQVHRRPQTRSLGRRGREHARLRAEPHLRSRAEWIRRGNSGRTFATAPRGSTRRFHRVRLATVFVRADHPHRCQTTSPPTSMALRAFSIRSIPGGTAARLISSTRRPRRPVITRAVAPTALRRQNNSSGAGQ